MTSSTAEVIVAHARDVTCAEATDVPSNVTSANSSDVGSAKAADVSSAKAAHVAAAKAAHVTSATAAHMASATTTVASATAAAPAGLRTSGNKAAGEQRSCQNHHHSSSHEILLWDRRHFPPQGLVERWRLQRRQTPLSRWTEDGDAYLSSLLNSRLSELKRGCARTRRAPDQQLGIDCV
jgi:hypothetical protein